VSRKATGTPQGSTYIAVSWCPNCGFRNRNHIFKLDQYSAFCNKCGHRVDEPPSRMEGCIFAWSETDDSAPRQPSDKEKGGMIWPKGTVMPLEEEVCELVSS